jgi:hypothetical protein
VQLRTSGSESFEQNEDIEFASAMQGTHVQGTYIYLCTGHVHLSMLKRPPSPNFAEKAALVSALFLSSSTIGRRFETISRRSDRGVRSDRFASIPSPARL